MPGVFFFQRLCMIRFFLPLGEKVVTAPHGEEPDTWMSVFAYDSLSYRMIRNRYSPCVSAAEIAERPMSAPPPSPQNAMTVARTWRSEERRVGKECRSRWSPY